MAPAEAHLKSRHVNSTPADFSGRPVQTVHSPASDFTHFCFRFCISCGTQLQGRWSFTSRFLRPDLAGASCPFTTSPANGGLARWVVPYLESKPIGNSKCSGCTNLGKNLIICKTISLSSKNWETRETRASSKTSWFAKGKYKTPIVCMTSVPIAAGPPYTNIYIWNLKKKIWVPTIVAVSAG